MDYERAVYHFKMGETYNSAEESYKAMEEFLEAERWSRDIKNDLLKGQISWYKGKLYFDRLDYTNALNMFTLASEYFALANSKLDLMNTYEQMALVCSKKNNLEDAIIFFNKSIMLAQEQKSAEINKLNNNDTTAIVVKYNRIILGFSTALSGVYYNKLNSPQQAIESLNIAYDKYAGGVAQIGRASCRERGLRLV